MNLSLLLRVATLCFLQASINAVVVGFVLPSSIFRLALLPVTIYCVYEVLPICLEATGTVLWGAFAGSFSITSLIQYIDTALVSRWTADAQGPTHITIGGTYDLSSKSRPRSKITAPMTAWQRLRFGYHISVSTRKAATPYQVKGLSPFSGQDPQYVPSRGVFLLNKAVILLLCYLVMDFSSLASQPDQNPVLYHPSRISWLNAENLGAEPLLIRSTTALGFWVNLYCIVQFYMGIFAFFTVGIGASKVEDWPPCFGPVSEAYSVRRFWG